MYSVSTIPTVPCSRKRTSLDERVFDAIAKLFGHNYDFLEKIGKGGQAEVYRAKDKRKARICAVKRFLPDAIAYKNIRRCFQNEVEAMQKMEHPQIPSYFAHYAQHDDDKGMDNLYLFMEYVAGNSLSNLIGGKKHFTESEINSVGAQLLDILNSVHSLGYIHRDVKPGNVILDRNKRVHLLDFGIATSIDKQNDGEYAGTPPYMSPEQLQGEQCSPQTDHYGIGLVMSCLARQETRTSTGTVLNADPREDIAKLESYSSGFKKGLIKMLALDPGQRDISMIKDYQKEQIISSQPKDILEIPVEIVAQDLSTANMNEARV